MKNILMILNYFYPDIASTSQLLTELCEYLQNNFHITVICAIPSYTGMESDKGYTQFIQYDRHENIKVIRVKTSKVDKISKLSRILYISSYFFGAVLAAIKEDKPDIVFALSQPPILGGLMGCLVKFLKKTKLIYCIEDFNPEQIEAVGYTKSKILIEAARLLDNASCHYADKIVVVGRDMRDTLKKRMWRFDQSKAVVINNWANENEIYPLNREDKGVHRFLKENGLLNKFVIMYSGNLGLYYDLDLIMRALRKFKHRKEVAFVFIGEGAKKKDLVAYAERHKMKNILFLPYQDKRDLIYSLNAADVHIVSNAKGIKGVSVPSKIYGILAVRKPILGVLERGSEAERIIRRYGCGVVCEPGQKDRIEETLHKMINKRWGTGTFYNKCSVDGLPKMEDSINAYRKLFTLVTNT